MTDPMLKRLFGHPEVVEILVRDMLPDDADRIDLSTLRKLGTELVGEALVRRYLFGASPDTGRLTRAEAAVIECATAEELMKRVQG